MSIKAHPVNIQEAVDQAVQLIQLQQLQVSHLQDKRGKLKLSDAMECTQPYSLSLQGKKMFTFYANFFEGFMNDNHMEY